MTQENNWHYARPQLAKKYLDLFELGLTSARGLFARRRMGKTEFLKKDLMPAAIARNYLVVYANLWDLEVDPGTALISEFYKAVEPKGFSKVWSMLKKIKASGKVPGVEATVEADLNSTAKIIGSVLMEAMQAFDKTKGNVILIIDEAQVLAYKENSHFAHALRAALDIRKERIKVIFAGSSEATLRKMFGVASEPFYNWCSLDPFDLLGEEFVIAMVEQVNKISKLPLSKEEALEAFIQLKSTPEFFRRYIEYYLVHAIQGSSAALQATKDTVFSDKNYQPQWDSLLAADKIILSMMSSGIHNLHSKMALQRLSQELGIEGVVDKSTVYNALKRLSDKNIVTKIGYGVYQFEDESFSDWIKHKE